MGYEGVFGVHDPIRWVFCLSPYGDGEFYVLGDVIPGSNDPFGCGISKVVASDVCMSSDFV